VAVWFDGNNKYYRSIKEFEDPRINVDVPMFRPTEAIQANIWLDTFTSRLDYAIKAHPEDFPGFPDIKTKPTETKKEVIL
jgi:hypothetical protein